MRIPTSGTAIFAAAVLAALAGCGSGKKESSIPDLPTNLPPLDAAVIWDRKQPLSEPATAFAKIVERTINRGDERFMQTHMDYAGMLGLAAQAWKLPPKEIVAQYEKKAREGGLPAMLARESNRGAVMTFLRVREDGDRRRALFRTVSRDGVQYFEATLAPDEHGAITIVDTYSHVSGMTSVDTLKRFLAPIALERNKDVLAELTPVERAYSENISGVAYLQMKMLEGNYADAVKIFTEFPREVKLVPEVVLMHISCTRQLNDRQAYADALQYFCDTFADHPGLDLMRLKLAFAKEKYKEALAPLDRLEEKVGPDGMLDYLRAQAYVQLKDLPKARACAQKAIEHDPTIERAYYLLLDATLEKKDYDETIRLLEKMEKNVSPLLLNLEQEATFKEFLQTDAYKHWLERRMQNNLKTE
ncbi:MAG: hypothetical protein KIS92_19220 [Planctomycetota bacterium]|nr:hypothetical protein [Planctomycetota bacterium]